MGVANLIMARRDFAVDSINHALDQLERTSPQKQAAPPAVENQVFEAANTTAVDLSYDRPAVIPEVIGHAISSGLIHDDNPVQMLVDGVKTIFGLAEEVNAAAGCQRVKIMDIGGGLPMNYDSDIESPTFKDYATMLQEQIPNLFNGKYEICTEFGRTIVQKAGWLLSKVEYTKMAGGRKIVTIHAGSNMFLRTAYLPKTWVHQMTIHQADGTPKTEADGPPMVCDVAGPLCFSGDLMATERLLPECNSGDYLVMHDAGGYTVGMYSRYNSRPCPPVYAYYEDKPSEIITIKKAETCEEVLQFWAATAPELEAELASSKKQVAALEAEVAALKGQAE